MGDLVLRSGIRPMPLTQPILDGRVSCGPVIEPCGATPYTDTFRLMARDLAYDIAEVPLVTHAMAIDAGTAITALPIVIAGGGLLHTALICRADSAIDGPLALRGARVGVRSYAQTTGVWMRGILEHEYNIGSHEISWVVVEDSHIKDFRDPAHVVRAEGNLFDMLRRGEVDALVASPHIVKSMPDLRAVIPDARKASLAWLQRLGVHAVNHVLALRAELVERHPEIVDKLARCFSAAREIAEAERLASSEPGRPFCPYGDTENRVSVDLLLGYAHEQGLTRRRFRYDDVFLPWPDSLRAR